MLSFNDFFTIRIIFELILKTKFYEKWQYVEKVTASRKTSEINHSSTYSEVSSSRTRTSRAFVLAIASFSVWSRQPDSMPT